MNASSQNFINVQRHDSTGVHGTMTTVLRLNTSTTEQAAAQTPAFPLGLHTITQTHHDEHNNYWAHMALCLHELSMSTESNRGRNNWMG